MRARRALHHWVLAAVARVARRLNGPPDEMMYDLAVYAWAESGASEAVDSLREALELVAQFSPMVLRRAPKDVVGVILWERGAPVFDSSSREVALGGRWVLARSVQATAAALVGEFVRARVRARVPPGTHDLRVARIVLEEQLRFSRRADPSGALVSALIKAWDDGFYGADAQAELHAQRLEGGLEELESMGVPRWGVRLFGRFMKRYYSFLRGRGG